MAKLQRALRTFDTSTLTANYQNLGAVIPFPVLKITFVNTSTVAVYITDLSTEDDFEIPGNSTLSIGETVCLPGQQPKLILHANTQLQIKQVTGAAAGKLVLGAFG